MALSSNSNRSRPSRSDRGATLVEYVLFCGCFVLVAVSAVGGLNSTARSYFTQSSSRIGQPTNRIVFDQNGNRQQQASTTSITAPPATTTTLAPTTTLPPTTIPPTTTTTIPPTTTTTVPPTTTTTTTIPPTTTTAAQSVIYGSVGENGTLTLTAPAGKTFKSVQFASYGTPTSTHPYAMGSCHSSTSSSKVTTAFLNKNSASIAATNSVFGDPCSGTVKRLSVRLTYG